MVWMRFRDMKATFTATVVCLSLSMGCAEDDPVETNNSSGSGGMAMAGAPAGGETAGGAPAGGAPAGGKSIGGDPMNGGAPVSGGQMMAGGVPNVGGAPMTGAWPHGMHCFGSDYPGDTWPACISDDGTYHKINDSISSIGRIASFESIADTLWRKATPPTSEDFTNARIEYALEEGLDSRVRRRYDSHVMKPADGSSCRDATPEVLEAYPDYCVGRHR